MAKNLKQTQPNKANQPKQGIASIVVGLSATPKIASKE